MMRLRLPFWVDRSSSPAPASVVVPRLALIVAVCALVAFGTLMIYSSSSITSMLADDSPTYYLRRQVEFVGIGAVIIVVFARVDYHRFLGLFLKGAWALVLALLVLTLTSAAGTDAYGATRWISVGGFTLQPSEFVKFVVVLVAAKLLQELADGELDPTSFLKRSALGIVAPLFLVFVQPDKGSTIICAATLIVMSFLAGCPKKIIAMVIVAGIMLVFLLAMRDSYSRQRVLVLLDPWSDEFGSGYQIIQGFYAFGSGGLFGLGIGMSRQKYSYLPMAYNDFIYAVIGEECGLVGTLGVLVGFVVIVWAGFEIARQAPDLTGSLIAAGSVSLFFIQLIVNIGGVLGMIPLSGKPVPFLSYGGSSVISCLVLVCLVLSVSYTTEAVGTVYDRRRERLGLAPEAGMEETDVAARPGFTLHEGYRDGRPGRTFGSSPLVGSRSAGGWQRTNLGPSPSERLRSARDASGRRTSSTGGRGDRNRR